MIMEPLYTDNAATQTRGVAIARGMAMAYVWGRQDAGESGRDTGYSQAFASVYALAFRLTDGYGIGPLQGAHHEWTETGRVLVKVSGGRILAVQVPEGAPDTTRAVAYPVPWADEFLPHWPGKVRKPAPTG